MIDSSEEIFYSDKQCLLDTNGMISYRSFSILSFAWSITEVLIEER